MSDGDAGDVMVPRTGEPRTYLAFAYHDYYPAGGSGDIQASFLALTDEAAVERLAALVAHSEVRYDQWELVSVAHGVVRSIGTFDPPLLDSDRDLVEIYLEAFGVARDTGGAQDG